MIEKEEESEPGESSIEGPDLAVPQSVNGAKGHQAGLLGLGSDVNGQ